MIVLDTNVLSALLPKGRRRVALQLAFERLLAEDLASRVLDFDSMAAATAAHLAASALSRRERQNTDTHSGKAMTLAAADTPASD